MSWIRQIWTENCNASYSVSTGICWVAINLVYLMEENFHNVRNGMAQVTQCYPTLWDLRKKALCCPQFTALCAYLEREGKDYTQVVVVRFNNEPVCCTPESTGVKLEQLSKLYRVTLQLLPFATGVYMVVSPICHKASSDLYIPAQQQQQSLAPFA